MPQLRQAQLQRLKRRCPSASAPAMAANAVSHTITPRQPRPAPQIQELVADHNKPHLRRLLSNIQHEDPSHHQHRSIQAAVQRSQRYALCQRSGRQTYGKLEVESDSGGSVLKEAKNPVHRSEVAEKKCNCSKRLILPYPSPISLTTQPPHSSPFPPDDGADITQLQFLNGGTSLATFTTCEWCSKISHVCVSQFFIVK